MEGGNEGRRPILKMASPPFMVTLFDQHGFEWEEPKLDELAVHGVEHAVLAPVSDEDHQMALRSHQTG
jgi:hypothetical protein